MARIRCAPRRGCLPAARVLLCAGADAVEQRDTHPARPMHGFPAHVSGIAIGTITSSGNRPQPRLALGGSSLRELRARRNGSRGATHQAHPVVNPRR